MTAEMTYGDFILLKIKLAGVLFLDLVLAMEQFSEDDYKTLSDKDNAIIDLVTYTGQLLSQISVRIGCGDTLQDNTTTFAAHWEALSDAFFNGAELTAKTLETLRKTVG